MLRLVKEMNQPFSLAALLEMSGKLAAVVRRHSPGSQRSHPKELPEEIIAIGGRASLLGVGEGKPGPDIDCSEDIALKTTSEYGHCVHWHQVARKVRNEILPSQLFLSWFRRPYQKRAGAAINGNLV